MPTEVRGVPAPKAKPTDAAGIAAVRADLSGAAVRVADCALAFAAAALACCAFIVASERDATTAALPDVLGGMAASAEARTALIGGLTIGLAALTLRFSYSAGAALRGEPPPQGLGTRGHAVRLGTAVFAGMLLWRSQAALRTADRHDDDPARNALELRRALATLCASMAGFVAYTAAAKPLQSIRSLAGMTKVLRREPAWRAKQKQQVLRRGLAAVVGGASKDKDA